MAACVAALTTSRLSAASISASEGTVLACAAENMPT
jgi:hypothetical protein